ncbi:hypothetical protein TELCIR_14901 [Teladorsagia circumcincta]|uniref:Uncharacterized protein n=1 Tax=Teladorsagia circumcincta TaxID=45464 RepID=A0A2G9U008_TELCI|nr:hypothetical protein TELCIR_14901 [Teladorsagia circumcincta]
MKRKLGELFVEYPQQTKRSEKSRFQMLEDEQLALLMQNKEFLRWIRHEQLPYISSSSRPAKVHRKRSSGKEHGPPVPEGPVVDELIINAEPDLKDRLKNVSKGPQTKYVYLFSTALRYNITREHDEPSPT